MLKNKTKNKLAKQKIEMSESFLIAILLTITGGFLDVYTYITRDGVFANAQTGNMVLFGISLAKGDYHSALKFSIPIFSFIVGVLLSNLLRKKADNKLNLHWRQFSLFTEILVLIYVGTLQDQSSNIWATVLVSFVCSMQVETFRKVHGLPFASTMCTGNLRSASHNIFEYLDTKNKKYIISAAKYLSIIAIFIFGAYISLPLTIYFSYKAVFLCIIPLSIAFLLMSNDQADF